MAADGGSSKLSGPVVIDASTVVEYLVVLELTDAATRLLHRVAAGSVELWAPDLVYPEAVSALRKLVRLGYVDVTGTERAAGALSELPITTTGSASLMAEAWRMRDFLTPHDAS